MLRLARFRSRGRRILRRLSSVGGRRRRLSSALLPDAGGLPFAFASEPPVISPEILPSSSPESSSSESSSSESSSLESFFKKPKSARCRPAAPPARAPSSSSKSWRLSASDAASASSAAAAPAPAAADEAYSAAFAFVFACCALRRLTSDLARALRTAPRPPPWL